MCYKVSKLQTHTIKDGSKYLLDSNIWLKILSNKNKPSSKDQRYLAFFQQLINNTKVKIILPSLIVSEVLNRILREVYMNKYANKNGFSPTNPVPKGYFKDVYRNTEDFRISYALLCDEIKNYHSSIILVNDLFGSDIKFKHVLSDPPPGLDFNDFYYYQLSKKKKYIIVTDDKDFWAKDVEIVTQNQTLIDKQNQYIVNKASKN